MCIRDRLTLVASRYAESIHVVLLWRCAGIALLFLVLAAHRGHACLRTLRDHPAHCLVAACLQACGYLGFAVAVSLTDTASAMLLIALSPLHAAVLGWLLLGDGVPLSTLLGLALCAVAAVLLHQGQSDEARRAGASEVPLQLLGDGVALATGVCFAAYITTIRALTAGTPTRKGDAAVDTTAVGVLSGAIAASVAGGAVASLRQSPLDGMWWEGAAAVGAIALIVFAFYAAMQHAARHVKPAELSMVWLLESALAPAWVALAGLNRAPCSAWTFAGLLLLVVTLVGHEAFALWKTRQVCSGAHEKFPLL